MERKLRKIKLDKVVLDGDWALSRKLRDSLASKGQVDPVHVWQDDDQYPIVAGRGRVVAARALEWERIEAFVYQSELEALHGVALAENVRRANPLSDARNLKASGLTGDEARAVSGMNKAQQERALGLLNLTDEIQRDIESGKLAASCAQWLCIHSKREQHAIMKLAERYNQESKHPRERPTTRQIRDAIRERKYQRRKKDLPKQIALPNVAQASADDLPDPVLIASLIRRAIAKHWHESGESQQVLDFTQQTIDWLESL